MNPIAHAVKNSAPIAFTSYSPSWVRRQPRTWSVDPRVHQRPVQMVWRHCPPQEESTWRLTSLSSPSPGLPFPRQWTPLQSPTRRVCTLNMRTHSVLSSDRGFSICLSINLSACIQLTTVYMCYQFVRFSMNKITFLKLTGIVLVQKTFTIIFCKIVRILTFL